MASLVIVEGVDQGRLLTITESLVSIGRDDTCTYQILDPLVSRKHLQIRFDPQFKSHVAGDYRSAHGVFINDKQIVLDTPLLDGDYIRIGNTTLMFLVEDHPDASSAAAAAQKAAKKKDEWKRTTMLDRKS
jgi:pSer/pThr/pTyr-binding forkhead associated (FHA) protein